jgi:hypothetical protein
MKSRAMNPAFLLCDDLQSHEPRANPNLAHRFLAGFNVKTEPVTESKETRAFSFAA